MLVCGRAPTKEGPEGELHGGRKNELDRTCEPAMSHVLPVLLVTSVQTLLFYRIIPFASQKPTTDNFSISYNITKKNSDSTYNCKHHRP